MFRCREEHVGGFESPGLKMCEAHNISARNSWLVFATYLGAWGAFLYFVLLLFFVIFVPSLTSCWDLSLDIIESVFMYPIQKVFLERESKVDCNLPNMRFVGNWNCKELPTTEHSNTCHERMTNIRSHRSCDSSRPYHLPYRFAEQWPSGGRYQPLLMRAIEWS